MCQSDDFDEDDDGDAGDESIRVANSMQRHG
jgi:hypothetical protein